MNSFRLLLLGAPGSGKGTITKKLKNVVPNLQSIASGDLLRQEIQAKTNLGQIASEYIAQGKLIPDDLIISLVANHIGVLSQGTTSTTIMKPWLLDGFPRTLHQATALNGILTPRDQNLTKVIELDVPESAILGRIETRYVHVPSGRIYNSSYNPPKVSGFDDVTGEPLVKRSDDNEETIIKRLKDYYTMVKPLKQFYKDKGILITVHGETSDIIFPQVLQALEER
ncbi:similar to Saccharomyces cerevisiae YER170W ADK2 Mitochondrial adenylate kinase, catalyzes the reversible synthesis of GTP and AMP from GDP and ADP [Maudiozyma barnettii]|uniref:Similar to Saccharomyces cerevisiae YER170W ADK2 Mitochondrial adenylate kinase, catalyzes the reversible synthesis of GTP and AMP from GDP and ADP n=1 Tax=Maudiozyma barnettii TaxID=61262 RepID=A0A8H2VHF8_9SACH|nr:adenylate kinase ADK2 [Kazachstania barnettii]CAB4255501.1 similar to Saccharomyces cerevisiae YER170W ADK2 Mitochondrial adenylate kinase, catalyzes the reversible synthesis of GTP and AMP from GDP and ADP [Kazachstania barnettii]CAD1784000.1 similar to Saccharomyces cerevisiae YER170W ADK2 Mitochondrial adenylate kinase, catalyzes the reversible synthesis of GTP and AMP from GDP and ADP [Kazachstania barnettii]